MRPTIEGAGGGMAIFSALKIADFPGLCVASLTPLSGTFMGNIIPSSLSDRGYKISQTNFLLNEAT